MDDEYTNIRWGSLLFLLVLAFLVEPATGQSTFAEIARIGLFELTVVSAILLSARNALVRGLGGALALIWFAASIMAMLGVEMDGSLASLSLFMVFAALIATFRILLRRGTGDVDTLLGAIFGYLLLAMAWTMLYLHIERWQPGSFIVPEGTDVWSSLSYFSLVTLTTLGYGDVLPYSPIARIAAGSQAVIGVLYIAVMVGSIVGNLKSTREPRHPDN